MCLMPSRSSNDGGSSKVPTLTALLLTVLTCDDVIDGGTVVMATGGGMGLVGEGSGDLLL